MRRAPERARISQAPAGSYIRFGVIPPFLRITFCDPHLLEAVMPDRFRSDSFTRREFVVGASALGAVWVTAASCARNDAAPTADSLNHLPVADTPAPPQQLVHFSADQAADIDAIASRIIPTTDTPGAHEAGVVFFIDRTMTTFAKEQSPMFSKALVDLRAAVQSKHGAGASFAKLSAEQQDAMLKSMEQTEFFEAMRFATVAGFLSLPKYGGNKDFIGWDVVGQEHVFEFKPPFGWYDRPENQQALLGTVL